MEDSQKREREAKKDEVKETNGGLSFHRVADLNRCPAPTAVPLLICVALLCTARHGCGSLNG